MNDREERCLVRHTEANPHRRPDADIVAEKMAKMDRENPLPGWRWPEEKSRPESPGGDSWYRQGGVEPVDFILSNNLPAWKGNVVEYVFRAGLKAFLGSSTDVMGKLREAEIQDIEKAIWWLTKRLEQLRGP